MGAGNTELRLSSQGLKVLKLFFERPRLARSGAEIMKEAGLLSGTLYPILIRFERFGLLESDWEKQSAEELGRPRRRRYTITKDGLEVARQALSELSVRGLRPVLREA